MEYERQSREARQHANTAGDPGRGRSISAPVGLRGRTTTVTNSSTDQETIIGLLASIPSTQGGKAEEWGVPPLPGPSGQCSKLLADAIWGFQDHWKKAGLFRHIDGVVDPGGNTLKQMNKLAASSGRSLVIPIDPRPNKGPNFLQALSSKVKGRPTNWEIFGSASISLSADIVGVPAAITGGQMKLTNVLNPGSVVPLLIGGMGISLGPIPFGVEVAPSDLPSIGTTKILAGPRTTSPTLQIEDLVGPCVILGISAGMSRGMDGNARPVDYIGGNVTAIMFNTGSNSSNASLISSIANTSNAAGPAAMLLNAFNSCKAFGCVAGRFVGLSVGLTVLQGGLTRQGSDIRPDPSVRR